jgi:prepilin-type N-terminal cleavage/methylation domain-containing protein/prepilin-type processing-associated H-X9-DG protein
MSQAAIDHPQGCPQRQLPLCRAFTLLELLIVIAIIASIFAVLLPAMSKARGRAREVACRANLNGLMQAFHTYATANDDGVVPSYNMTGVSGGASSPMDGWGPILHKGRYVMGNRQLSNNPFCCPDTRGVAGVASTQTGSNPDNPKGYMDWPAILTISQNYSASMPQDGYEEVLRVGYWINADNPIGIPQTFIQGAHFSGSVGYGPDPSGKIMRQCKLSQILRPSNLITIADGLYAGKQEATRLGDLNSRIGYRHAGQGGSAGVAFADGHVSSIRGNAFPRKLSDNVPLAVARAENLGDQPSVYSNPQAILAP